MDVETAFGQRCPDGTLGDGDVDRWAVSSERRGTDDDQRIHDGEASWADIEQCLSTLKRRDIVVIDNVLFHKVAGVEEAIQAVGASRVLAEVSWTWTL